MFCYLFDEVLVFFESAAVGRVSGFSWPLVGQGRVKRGAGLCLLLVGFVDWFAAIHDHWFAGCAFGRRAPGEFRHRLPYIVQRRLSVHRNWRSGGRKEEDGEGGKRGTRMNRGTRG